VDKEFLAIPRKWDASSVGKFMLWIGPTSSVFDITTYLIMFFVICPAVVGGRQFHQLTDAAKVTTGAGSCCTNRASAHEASCDPITSNLYDAVQQDEVPDTAIKALWVAATPPRLLN
jgi:hypothetical protein